MTFLPILLTSAAALLYLVLLSEMKKESLMRRHRRETARTEFEQIYTTDTYDINGYRKCS